MKNSLKNEDMSNNKSYIVKYLNLCEGEITDALRYDKALIEFALGDDCINNAEANEHYVKGWNILEKCFSDLEYRFFFCKYAIASLDYYNEDSQYISYLLSLLRQLVTVDGQIYDETGWLIYTIYHIMKKTGYMDLVGKPHKAAMNRDKLLEMAADIGLNYTEVGKAYKSKRPIHSIKTHEIYCVEAFLYHETLSMYKHFLQYGEAWSSYAWEVLFDIYFKMGHCYYLADFLLQTSLQYSNYKTVRNRVLKELKLGAYVGYNTISSKKYTYGKLIEKGDKICLLYALGSPVFASIEFLIVKLIYKFWGINILGLMLIVALTFVEYPVFLHIMRRYYCYVKKGYEHGYGIYKWSYRVGSCIHPVKSMFSHNFVNFISFVKIDRYLSFRKKYKPHVALELNTFVKLIIALCIFGGVTGLPFGNDFGIICNYIGGVGFVYALIAKYFENSARADYAYPKLDFFHFSKKRKQFVNSGLYGE